MLFDTVNRTDHQPAAHADDEFTFLNRSARPVAERMRQLLEHWVEDYPETERHALAARLRAEFEATFFELFLHHLLRALGCELRLHPVLEGGGSSRPDFLARFPTGQEAIIEAKVATDESDEERRRAARFGALFDEINKIESPNFFLRIEEVSSSGTAQPSGRRVRAFIERRIADLDPDEVTVGIERYGFDALPTWTFEERGFELTFSLVPKSPAARARTGRAIGSYPTESGWGGSAGAIHKAILRKARKYGRMDSPFVIAVNTLSSWGSNRVDVTDALFGSERVVWSPRSEESRVIRAPDGVWHGQAGPRNRHLSAVLVGSVFPWNLPIAPVCIYHNPYAERPCTEIDWRISQAVLAKGHINWTDGVVPGALLGLESDWPGELFDS